MKPTSMEIRLGGLNHPAVMALLYEHLSALAEITPSESMHALNPEELSQPDVTFWSAWFGKELMGFGALKELTPNHGEIKSMRTAKTSLRKGVGREIMRHILEEAKRRGYHRLSLETGSTEDFHAAHRLYEQHGFTRCPPFGGYREDPNSVFMTKNLS